MGASVNDNGGTFDLTKGIGRDIMVYIETKMYEGKPQNNATDFRPLAA
jgi:hypothetical protein